VRRILAGNDIVWVAHREAIHLNMSAPGVFEALNSIRGEDQVQVKWPILQLDKSLPCSISAV